MTGIPRRSVIAGGAGLAGAALIGVPTPAAAKAGAKSLALNQGTDLAARLSPDRRTIALDLLGVLWLIPAAGGPAKRLTSDFMDIAQPDWAPGGDEIAFQAYAKGSFDLWTIRPDGSKLTRLTSGPFDHREPRFHPAGRPIAFSSDRSGSYGVYTWDNGKITPVADGYEPAWSPDGTKLAFVVANTRIDVVEMATGARTTAVTVPAGTVLHAPEWTPDGHELIYTQVVDGRSELWRQSTPVITGQDVFPFRVSWRSANEFLYTADGSILRGGTGKGRIGFTAVTTIRRPTYRKRHRDFDSTTPKPVRGLVSPVLSPDGRQVAFCALNDIWIMEIGQKPRREITGPGWKSHPAWSPDGRQLSYSTDRSGKLDIWLRDLRTGADRQLTTLPNAAAVSGSWSHDGAHLAFLDQTGEVYTVEVATGAVEKIYAATFEPGRPTWSADNRTVALAAIVPYSARYREGLSKILLIDRATGAGRYQDPLTDRSIQTRGDDGPVWSPDGTRIAFVVASVLWVAPVAPDGTFTGPPRQVTREVTDAPTWSGDSRTLLYLSNGRLRLVAAAGGEPRTVPVRLSWANTSPRGRTVIRAGRVWDGSSKTLKSDIDIVVDGNRISAVEPHRAGRDGVQVDVRDSVVIPGIIDMHHHREMQGYSYGARQGRLWLSLGITTTRSPGSPAYHMVEERESIQSGARLGPRYLATGEAIDGSRIFYNFMRPTFSDGQLALELERAAALDYDLMKAYVRLSAARQRAVIDWAHRQGIPATSHYHYPALAIGGDGMEHVGATNRLGYSRTVSALGAVYSDVADIFLATGASLTPTLFNSLFLLATDDSLVVDERVKTLYPSWEYANLQASLASARATDQTANLANLARQVAHVLRLIRGGGTVVTGTDSPIVPTAVSTHMNLRGMVEYGATPWEALSSATRVSGEFLDLPLGRLAPGYLADLVVLGGDPLTDIKRAADVQQVMANGVLHTPADLMAPFGGSAPRRSAPVIDRTRSEGFWWHDPHWVETSRHACCSDD
ncbi:amidohydrolase family protein [Actinoplanes sp. NPDC051343]|uniref:amidohydrolase family protein n=1 Tax=Actinoplanes sp. NPDC051343 TaxID=3363906 RepID=UPI0037BE140A